MSSLDATTVPITRPEARRADPPKRDPEVGISAGGKRKAEDDLQGANEKLSKVSMNGNAKPRAGELRSNHETFKAKTAVSRSSNAVPRIGNESITSKAGVSRANTEASKVGNTSKIMKTAPLKNTNDSATLAKSVTKPGPPTPASASPKAAPKKGSYAEILARAKQNQSAPVGAIVHKPKEKLSSKKEIALQREIAVKDKRGPNGKPIKGGPGSKRSSPGTGRHANDSRVEGRGVKHNGYQGTGKMKPATSYQGTAKVKPQTAYKGTMKGSAATTGSRKGGYDSEPERIRSQAQAIRRRGYSEDEDDDDDIEEDDDAGRYRYASSSEDYSDMDAGFDDVEEEDALAAREARKEDLKEHRVLEEAKRQKEKKKMAVASGKR